MALSTNTFTYNGGAQTFTLSLSLGYLTESDITAFVVGDLDGGGDQILREFTFDSEFVVRLTAPLTIGDEVTVERTVSKTSFVVDFETGGDVTARNLMILYKQVFMAQQELLDGRVGDFDPTGDAASAEASAIDAAASAVDAALSAIEAAGFDPATFYTKVQADVIHGGFYTKAEQDQNDADQDTAVDTLLGFKAPLASPVLTGTPEVPTAAVDTSSDQAASTAFVVNQIASGGGVVAVTGVIVSGNWTPHADAKSVIFYATGGGEAGLVGSSQNQGGNGGRAGSTIIHFEADPQALGLQAVGVGAGGTSSGANGGDTTVGSIILARGGGGSTTDVGQVKIKGGKGSSLDINFGDSTGGSGGASYWGGNESPGGGGHGAADTGGGDDGGDGIVLIVEYG